MRHFFCHDSSCIHHLHYIICIISCNFSRLNAVISRTCLTPLPLCLPSLPPSASAIRPSVSNWRVHRPLLHGLQAVHYSAQSGLPSQSCRYPQTHTQDILSDTTDLITSSFFSFPSSFIVCKHSMNIKWTRLRSGGGFLTKLMRLSEKGPPTRGAQTYPSMRGYIQPVHRQVLTQEGNSSSPAVLQLASKNPYSSSHTHPEGVSKFHSPDTPLCVLPFFCAPVSCSYDSHGQVQC